MRFLIILLAAAGLWGCSGNENEYAPARVADVYGIMRDYNGPDSLAARRALATDSVEVKAFMKTISELPYDTLLVEGWASSRAVEMFTPPVDSVFNGTESLAAGLGKILGRAADEGLELPQRRYAAVVYDRPKSILFVDSVMLIALNHYLGADFEGYSHWPYFMRRTKTPENMPYDMAEALVATSYPFKGNGTLLSRLLYEGALAHAKQSLAGGDAASALGYDESTWKSLLDNEAAMWHSIVADRLLYDTSQGTVDRLVAPSARVTVLGTEAPGRVGRFIGYRIVESYIKNNPDTTLPQLLAPDFYTSDRTLAAAGYAPK